MGLDERKDYNSNTNFRHRKQLSKLLEGNLGKGTTIWKEIEESFVSTIPGGDESIAPSKL